MRLHLRILPAHADFFTTVSNGSFESGFDGWTATGNVSIQNLPPYAPTDGTHLAAFNALDSTPNGTLGRTIIIPNTIASTHRLRFDVGNLSYSSQDQKLNVQIIEVIAGTRYFRVDDTITISGTSNGTNHWQAASYEFPNPVTGSVQLLFSDVSTTTHSTDLLLDHVRIEDSRYVNIRSSYDYPNPGVNIGVAVQGLGSQPDGTTFFSRQFYQGETVTLTAPASLGPGRTFHEWAKNGGHFGSSTAVTFTVTEEMSLKAVYLPLVTADSNETFKVAGFVGCGPFSPLSEFRSLTNQSSGPLAWTARVEVNDAPWLAVWPPSGTLEQEYSASLQLHVTAGATSLPAGSHQGRVIISAGGANTEIPVSILLRDPTRLVVNGSFENGFDGWTTLDHVSVETGAPYTTTDGVKLAAFNAVNSTPNGFLSQAFDTEVGVRYSLDFDVGVLAFNTLLQRLHVEVTDDKVESPPLLNTTLTLTGGGGSPPQQWTARHYEFVATSLRTKLAFADTSGSTTSIDLTLDNVRVFNPGYQLTVTTTADEDDGSLGQGSGDSLREALQVAQQREGGNLIRFAPSLDGAAINLVGGQLMVDSDVSIDASELTNWGITVSAGGHSRVIDAGANSLLKNLTITGGNNATAPTPLLGGGIYNHGQMMLLNCRLTANSSALGGGGLANGGSVVLDHTTLSENHADSYGGGLSNHSGIAAFHDSTVSGNTATLGAGLSCQGPFGGAWVVLENSTVSANAATGMGGAYGGLSGYKSWGILAALNTTFSENTAAQAGGAIQGWNNVDLRHCTVSGNSCTLPDSRGGGISSAQLTLQDSIVAGNTAATDSDITDSTTAQNGVNFIGGDPQLGTLANNGGATSTMKPATGSPVIDAAGNPGGLPLSDQRGKARLSGSALDIGAVEVQQIVVNTLTDESDGVNAGGISLRDAIGTPYAAPPGELIRFAPSLAGGTIVITSDPLYALGFLGPALAIDAANLPGGITLSGNDSVAIFELYFSNVYLRGLTLTHSAGSAIEMDDSTLDMTDCVIRDNQTAQSGAGLAVYGSTFGSASVVRCTFQNNSAAGSGGAINNSGITWVRDSTFSGNHSGSGGGAIESGIYRVGMVVINSTFSGNSSGGPGGAIKAGSLKLVHSTITQNNSLSGPGGGIFSTSTTGVPELGFSIANSVIAGNSAPGGSDIAGPIDDYQGQNFIGGNPMLAPLADYGGPTATRPPLPGSPLIDAAINLPDTFPNRQIDVGHDQRGSLRPSGPLPDIGAVEAFPFSSLALIDSDGDGIDDRLEPAYGLVVGTNNSGLDSDGDGSPDAVEIANMTDPMDPSSILKILSFVPSSSVASSDSPLFDVTFSSFPGLSYTLECDQNLDFSSPAARVYPHGPASGFTTTEQLPLLPGRDFVRVRREP